MKVCLVTGSRAEYGLLRPLITELKNDKYFKIQIIATGSHLSQEYGLTYREIEKNGFKIDKKIDIDLTSDSPVGIAKSMGLGMKHFAEAYNKLRPELIIVLGDRFEIFSAVSSAVVAKIPIAHLHGGELTFGAYDDYFRHAITKMSHLHFTSTEVYRRRVIQLGENPDSVFNVGALSIDNIKKIKLMPLKKLEEELSFKLDKPFFMVTFHPATLENESPEKQINELLNALSNFDNYKIIFTMPNADSNNRKIIKLIKQYVSKNKERSAAYSSLGQLRYLSALKHCEMMIGNSSSGIIEMPVFKKPTVNIGSRQEGRIFPKTLIQCEPEVKQITSAIKKGLSIEFRQDCNNYKSIYGNGNTAARIKSILKRIKNDELIKKYFYDISFNVR